MSIEKLEAYGEGDIITGLSPEFLDEFEKEIQRDIPAEKIRVALKQEKIAKIMRQAGSTQIDGIGQLVAKIDARLFFRMQHQFGSHEGWLDDFLADNKELCAPGYNAKRKSDFRHGKTFVSGKPV